MEPEQLISLLEYNQYNFDNIVSYIFGYVGVLWILFCLWVLKDINSRTKNIFVITLVVLFVFFFNIPGLILYLLLRPEKTLEEARALDLYQISQLEENLITCSTCRSIVRKNYGFCTVCGDSLFATCDYCGKQINPIWENCGYCGHTIVLSNREIFLQTRSRLILNLMIVRINMGRYYSAFIEGVAQVYRRRKQKFITGIIHNRLRLRLLFGRGFNKVKPNIAINSSNEMGNDSINEIMDVINLIETRKKKENV